MAFSTVEQQRYAQMIGQQREMERMRDAQCGISPLMNGVTPLGNYTQRLELDRIDEIAEETRKRGAMLKEVARKNQTLLLLGE